MKAEVKQLATALAECIQACNNCADGCLDEEDVEMKVRCIQLDRECIAICSATLSLAHCGSIFIREMVALCQTVCEACAEECAHHEEGHCQDCAKACSACAEACSDLLTALA